MGVIMTISDQVFTIVSSVTSNTEPNGGESWQATVGAAGHGQRILAHSDATANYKHGSSCKN